MVLIFTHDKSLNRIVVIGLMEIEVGNLGEYIKVKALKPFLSNELAPGENNVIPALFKFDTGGSSFSKYGLSGI